MQNRRIFQRAHLALVLAEEPAEGESLPAGSRGGRPGFEVPGGHGASG